jgi:hypothetical protein
LSTALTLNALLISATQGRLGVTGHTLVARANPARRAVRVVPARDAVVLLANATRALTIGCALGLTLLDPGKQNRQEKSNGEDDAYDQPDSGFGTALLPYPWFRLARDDPRCSSCSSHSRARNGDSRTTWLNAHSFFFFSCLGALAIFFSSLHPLELVVLVLPIPTPNPCSRMRRTCT